MLKRRATENYLSDNAVKRVKGVGYEALGPFEKLKQSQHPWSKVENWQIAREMSLEDLMATDLGIFLAEL